MIIRAQMLMCGKVTKQCIKMTADTIPKNYLWFSIDFNFIYVILNIIKVNRKGEFNWRLTKSHNGYLR